MNVVPCIHDNRVRRSGMHCVRMIDGHGTGGISVMIDKLVLKYKLIGRYYGFYDAHLLVCTV
jgi:hypothetical protein